MKTYLEERIGHPNLFTGRKRELDTLLKWIEGIKPKISKSKAIVSRRKTGKSALMERLFNIVFEQNDQVVPFYFEIRETDQWIADFAGEFFFTFMRQYLAFQTRNPEYMDHNSYNNHIKLMKAAEKENLDYIADYIENFEHSKKEGEVDALWNLAREAPANIAKKKDVRILQMIDEFQFINKYIYRDKECKNPITNLAGSYLHTAERKHAPMLVSGSWIGWLIEDLNKMLPGRFVLEDLDDMPRHEAIGMALIYSEIMQIPINYETACIMAELTEGSPFYMSSLFQSAYPDKDFTTEKGILEVLDFETFDRRGSIRGTWMEYIASSINEVNDINGKKIVFYICQNRDREVTRKEIKDDLDIDIENGELERRLKAFVKSDIIEQGETDFDYRAVQDNIFDKVFRGIYQKEIDGLTPATIKKEYRERYKKLQGEFNNYKGKFSELLIINHLRYKAYKKNELYCSMMNNMPDDFRFVNYSTVWSYSASPVYKKDIQVDVVARAKDDEYSLIGEVKNREAKFSLKEAELFLKKASEVIEKEKLEKYVLFVFSSGGFYKNAMKFIRDRGIAWSCDKRFMEL